MDYFYYTFEILAVYFWSQIPHLDCASAATVIAANTTNIEGNNRCFRTGQEVMEENEWDPENSIRDWQILALLLPCMHLITFAIFMCRLKTGSR